MKKEKKQSTAFKRIAATAASVLLWIAVWWIISAAVNKELLVPSPIVTAKRLFELVTAAAFWRSAGTSLLRILAGYFFGVILGTILAIGSSACELFNRLTSPLNTVIRATPVSSFIILALVWLKSGRVPSFIAFLMVTPIVWNQLKAGLKNANGELLEMTKCYKFSPIQSIRYFWLPTVMPQLISALTTSLGFAWKAGIAAEVLCTPRNSIGKEIYESKLYLETPDLFAWTIVVVIFSLIIEKLLKLALGRASRNMQEVEK